MDTRFNEIDILKSLGQLTRRSIFKDRYSVVLTVQLNDCLSGTRTIIRLDEALMLLHKNYHYE